MSGSQPVAVRFKFNKDVPLDAIRSTLLLAMTAVESLFGAAAVRLAGAVRSNAAHRACDIDVRSEVGTAIARVFTGLASREFGAGAFEVDSHLRRSAHHSRLEMAA